MAKTKVTGLTRYTYKDTKFQGWRVSVSNRGERFVKYFSEKALGGYNESRRAAVEAIAQLRNEFEVSQPDKKGMMTKASINRCNGILGLKKLR